MSDTKTFAYGLSALLAGGGYMGYKKANSVHSLRAGLGFGATYAVAGLLLSQKQELGAYLLGTAASALLTVAVFRRMLKTNFSPVPTFIFSGGFVGLIVFGYDLYNYNSQGKIQ